MTPPPGRAACWAACAAAGACLVLAFPPFDLWPLAALAPAVPCWVAAHPALSRRTVLVGGLLFGGFFFLGTNYWIGGVMSRYGELGVASAAGVLVLLLGYLAAFPTLFALLVRRVATRSGPLAALAAAPAIWAALELGRNYLLGGFPWVRLGTALHAAPPLLQVASVTGVYGLSALLMLPAAGAAAALLPDRGRRGRVFLAAGLAALALAALWGGWRAAHIAAEDGPALRAACVQGNVPQDRKWEAAEASRNLERHLRLSRRALAEGAELLVWPESSMPYALRSHQAFARPVRELVVAAGVPLVLGSLDRRAGGAVFNSAFLLGSDGRVRGVYDKFHLVPFGEYVPLRRLLSFAESLVAEVGDLSRGEGVRPLGGTGGVPSLGMLICYEVVFPELARGNAAAGATLLVNITNDAWFGRTSAPHQHFAEAVVRAVETGRWVVRAANTGVSGIVDPAGRVVTRSRLGEATVVAGTVAPRTALTPYVQAGDAFAWACVILTLVASILPGRRAAAGTVIDPRS